jgi:hypothetical protein
LNAKIGGFPAAPLPAIGAEVTGAGGILFWKPGTFS